MREQWAAAAQLRKNLMIIPIIAAIILALLAITNHRQTTTKAAPLAQAVTVTATRTLGCGSVVTATPSPTWTNTPTATNTGTPSPTRTRTATGCGLVVVTNTSLATISPTRTGSTTCSPIITATPSPTWTRTSTSTPTGTSSPTRTRTTTPSCGPIVVTNTPVTTVKPDLRIFLSVYRQPNCMPGELGILATVSNGPTDSNVAAGPFEVEVNGVRQSVSGLASGQSISLRFPGLQSTNTGKVDVNNTVAESSETNNTATLIAPTLTPPPPCTPTPTSTRTRTRTASPTRTITPTLTGTVYPDGTINGYVRQGSSTGPGVPNVQIIFAIASGSGNLVAMTDATGFYQFKFNTQGHQETLRVWTNPAGSPNPWYGITYGGGGTYTVDFVLGGGTPVTTVSRTPTRTSSPTRTPTRSVTRTSSATSYPAWAAWTSYAVGARVSYGGANYQCLQGHTSQPGWEPPNTPALWQRI